MYWNLNDDIQRGRCFRHVEHSERQLRPFVEARFKLIKSYVGNLYGKALTNDNNAVVVNLIKQMVEIYTNLMVAARPRFKVNVQQYGLLPTAKRYEINLNHLVGIVRLEETIRLCVMDALFKIGICKVGLGDSTQVKLDNDETTDPGFPFAERVSLDDWVHDMTAIALDRVKFCGNFYCVDPDRLEQEDIFDKETRQKLKTSFDERVRNRNASELGGDTHSEEMDEQIELLDLWFPESREMVTIDSRLKMKPLSVRKFEDDPYGPYHFLGFGDVPDNTMPVAPAEDVYVLANLYNNMLRKLSKQARRQKKLVAYNGDEVKTADAIKNAEDGTYVAVTNPESLMPMNLGGIDQGNFGFSLQILDIFNRAAGNLESLGGLGPQADTVGQESIITKQSGALLAKMQAKVVHFTQQIGACLGLHLWRDQIGFQTTADLSDMGFPNVRYDASWMPGQREGHFSQYDFEVEPYSMQYSTPGEDFTRLSQVTTQLLIPMLQLPSAQQSGMEIDVEEFVNIAADKLNAPELRRVVKFNGQPLPPNPSPDELPKAKSTAPRHYVRHNVSQGGTEQGKRTTDIQKMMSAAMQDNNQ